MVRVEQSVSSLEKMCWQEMRSMKTLPITQCGWPWTKETWSYALGCVWTARTAPRSFWPTKRVLIAGRKCWPFHNDDKLLVMDVKRQRVVCMMMTVLKSQFSMLRFGSIMYFGKKIPTVQFSTTSIRSPFCIQAISRVHHKWFLSIWKSGENVKFWCNIVMKSFDMLHIACSISGAILNTIRSFFALTQDFEISSKTPIC